MDYNLDEVKPFLKWAGGKRQLLTVLENKLPKILEGGDDFTYIEPFVGGGAMLFFMLKKYPNIKNAVINDININLIKAYKFIKSSPEKLIAQLLKIQTEYLKIKLEADRKAFFLNIRERFNSGELSDMDNTAYLIFLNKTCFNGLYRVNSKGLFNVPFGRYSNPLICDEKTIYADSELLQKVHVLNGDFESTEPYATANTFLYFDPPYRPLNTTSCFNSYAKEIFDDNEQIRLKRYIDRLTKKRCLLLLSNSDGKGKNPYNDFFDSLYQDYIIERIYAKRAINSKKELRGALTELLIRNYTLTDTLKKQTLTNILQQTSYHERSAYPTTI